MDWPHPAWEEAEFLSPLVERSGCGLLLDISNLHANSRNHGGDPLEFLGKIPLQKIGYGHVGGGVEHDGLYHDTHAAPVPVAVLDSLEELCARCDPPGILPERDDNFPSQPEFFQDGCYRSRRDPWPAASPPGGPLLDREQLQQRQYSLVHALVGEGPAPDAFPLHRLVLVRQGLAIKRRREALSSWRGLGKRLGESVYSLFDQYAAARPRPAGGCPKMNGYQFWGWLSQQQIGVGIDIVARFQPTPGGLRARHPVVTKLWLLGYYWFYSRRRPFIASYRGILAGAPSFR